MATHNVKEIKDCALLLANDLRTGLTVYLTETGNWSENFEDAWRLIDNATADKALAFAIEAEADNTVIGPYLVDAATDGVPTHIRELLRVDGPSINYLQNQSVATAGPGD